MKKGRKLNTEIASLRDSTCEGKFLGFKPLVNETGEIRTGNFDQELWMMEMEDFKGGEIRQYWADAGLRGTFKMAKIESGMKIIVEHTGKKEIEQGTVQTYDVFLAE